MIIILWIGSVGFRLSQRYKDSNRAYQRATEEVKQKEEELKNSLEKYQKLQDDYKKLEQSKAAEKIRVASMSTRIPSNVNSGVEQWRTLVAQYDWPVDSALKIMSCESGGNYQKINWGDAQIGPEYRESAGLFQIRRLGTLNIEELLQPERNIQLAYYKWVGAKGRFGTHWVNCSRRHGIY